MSNKIVIPPGGLVCWSGGKMMPAYKPCQYLEECVAEYGFRIIVTKTGSRRLLRKRK